MPANEHQRTPPILTPMDVKNIRREYWNDDKATHRSLAIRWGINRKTIADAINGEGAYKGYDG